MDSKEIESFIAHYGKKGMRWGVRKSRSVKETKVREKRKKIVKNRRTLSDAVLNKHIERLTTEKKLKSLAEEDLKPGRTIAKKILSDSGQKVARTVVTGAALYATKAALDKKFSLKDAAGYVAPRPKNK